MAEALVGTLSAEIDPGAAIAIDTQARKTAATTLALRLGLKPSFGAARMHNGPESKLPMQQTFGIITIGLG